MSLIYVDVDGTLIDSVGRPNKMLISSLNRFYNRGDIIIILSSRPAFTMETTMRQLKGFGLKFNGIIHNSIIGNFKYPFITASQAQPWLIDNDEGALRFAKANGFRTIKPIW